jgi:uncharacterized protein (TIGR02145 family)
MKTKPNKIALAVFLLTICFALNAQQTVTDIDGNIYQTVTIGSQKWMKENLKTTHYNNGDSISTTFPETMDYSGESTPKYQWAYDGKDSLAAIYGRLYTWYTATDNRNVCPTGWHVPSDAEWTTLTNYLGGESAAFGKLKETNTIHWNYPNTDATNEVEFTALPGGSHWADGSICCVGMYGHWWTTTSNNTEMAWRRALTYDGSYKEFFRGAADKTNGWSIRCIEDPIPDSVKYFGQTPPGNMAVIFAPGIISKANSHCRLVVSPDGKEIFWNIADFNTWESKVYSVTYSNGKWSDLVIPSFATTGISSSVVFSPDGKKLFFDYRDDVNSNWTINYVEKVDTGWSEPESDGFLIDLSSSFTTTGNVYYDDAMANTPQVNGIYTANYSDTGLSNIQPLPEAINPANIINYTPCIAPDESYLLFASNRPMTGGNDANMYIYVSFNNEGVWSEPQKINDAINFSGKARLPSISPDGKYLFFCGDDRNFYWVDIEAIELLRPNAINTIPKSGNISVFPNPSNGLVNISYSNTVQQATIEIYNLQGTQVFSKTFQNAPSATIDLTGYPKGLYMVKVIADGVSYEEKILLE